MLSTTLPVTTGEDHIFAFLLGGGNNLLGRNGKLVGQLVLVECALGGLSVVLGVTFLIRGIMLRLF